LRYGGIALLAIAALVSLWPSLFLLQSNQAVVNARVTTLAAPVAGQVSLSDRVQVGARLTNGRVLGQITNRNFTSEMPALRAETAAWRKRIDAFEEQRTTLKAKLVQLNRELVRYQDAYIARVTTEIKAARHERSALASRREQLDRQVTRLEKLLTRGAVTEARFEEVVADRDAVGARFRAQQDKVERLKRERKAARQGVFLGDGFNNTPYSGQRRDELEIRLAELETRIADARGHLRRLEGAQEVALTRQQNQGMDVIQTPTPGYVWEIQATSGSTVARNDPVISVVDCRSVFVDVTLPQSRSDDVTIGQSATVRVLNTDRQVTGRVAAVRGARTVPRNLALENVDLGRELDDIQVLVQFPERPDPPIDHRFCNVGQRAVVDFDGGGLFERLMSALRWLT
jgi:multidrug resistance efflux pump